MQKLIAIYQNLILIGILICLLPSVVVANIFVVINTSDSGAGSLRQAMIDARTNPGPDTVIFNIPTSDAGYDAALGIWRIQPTIELPEMWSDGTVIDGAASRLKSKMSSPAIAAKVSASLTLARMKIRSAITISVLLPMESTHCRTANPVFWLK